MAIRVMKSILRSIRSKLFRIDGREVCFERRGFHSTNELSRAHLERVGKCFLEGYHSAMDIDSIDVLGDVLSRLDRQYHGFAFEGAAMALALLDHVFPTWRSRWQQFLVGPGANHCYMLHVGYGWAIARLPWLRRRPMQSSSRFDPVLRWLVLDGFGFHEGYFHWLRFVTAGEIPANLSGYGLRAFDQGLGRSLWFVVGADVGRISGAISAFRSERRADLWSGIGLACAYAGGADYSAITALRQSSECYASCLAQGAAFAAKARERAGNPADHTTMVCEALCGMPAASAAMVTDECLRNLRDSDIEPAFECWRQGIQIRMAEETIAIGRK